METLTLRDGSGLGLWGVKTPLAHVQRGIPPSSHNGGVELTDERKDIGSLSMDSPCRALADLGALRQTAARWLSIPQLLHF